MDPFGSVVKPMDTLSESYFQTHRIAKEINYTEIITVKKFFFKVMDPMLKIPGLGRKGLEAEMPGM